MARIAQLVRASVLCTGGLRFKPAYEHQKKAFLAEWSKASDLRPDIIMMRGFKSHRMQLKYKIQNTKYKIQNTKYKIQNTKYKIQNIIIFKPNY